MKLVPVFVGRVDKGNLVLSRPGAWREHLESLSGEVEVTVRRRRRLRSKRENDYYWAVVVELVAEEMGVFPAQAHEKMKADLLRKQVQTRSGRMIEVIRSTTELSTVEMEDYLEKCRRWAALELNVYIPLPNEVET